MNEAKPEGLHLSEMLQGLQAVPRTPIPSRLSWVKQPVNLSENNERNTQKYHHKDNNNSVESSEKIDQDSN